MKSGPVAFERQDVCDLPGPSQSIGITAAGDVFAFHDTPDDRIRFSWNGRLGDPFDDVAPNRDGSPAFFFSPDARHFAFVGIRDGFFVCRDGTEGPTFPGWSRSVPPVFSADGAHLAYGVMLDDAKHSRLILDGDMVDDGDLAPNMAVFAPVGDRFAYVRLRLTGDRAECQPVIDRDAGPWVAGIRNAPGAMQFSPDGRRFAFQEVDGSGHCRWSIDGVTQQWANENLVLDLPQVQRVGVVRDPVIAMFSPDSRRFAYFADVPEKGVAIIEDDVRGPLFKAVGRPAFSPDSRRLAYLAHTYRKTTELVSDGSPSRPTEHMWPGPAWSMARTDPFSTTPSAPGSNGSSAGSSIPTAAHRGGPSRARRSSV